MKTDLVERFSEVFQPNAQQWFWHDLKLDRRQTAPDQFEANRCGKDGIHVGVRGVLLAVDDLELQFEVEFGVDKVVIVLKRLFTESDVVTCECHLYFLRLIPVDPESTMQGKCVVSDTLINGWIDDGEERIVLIFHSFLLAIRCN